MKIKKYTSIFLLAIIVSVLFSFSLRGCGWSSIELFAAISFFAVALIVSVSSFVLAQRWWAALLAVLLVPLMGAWVYSLSGLLSPGSMTVGPCVERSTWTAFPSLYLISSCAMILNKGIYQYRTIAIPIVLIAIGSAAILLRNLL